MRRIDTQLKVAGQVRTKYFVVNVCSSAWLSNLREGPWYIITDLAARENPCRVDELKLLRAEADTAVGTHETNMLTSATV